MSVEMDERFAAALRELLVTHTQTTDNRHRWVRWPRQWSVRAGVLLAVVAGGGGLAAAAGLVLSGGGPGSQNVVALAAPVTVTGAGTETVQLGPRPAGANAIYLQFACLTDGTFTWGRATSYYRGPGETCTGPLNPADIAKNQTSGAVTLEPGQDTLTITAAPGDRWRLIATYASTSTVPWAVNASGQTYGTPNQNGTPDLIAVMGSNHVSGYVYAKQLQGPMPTTPAEAATWAQTHPGPRTITVYKSDGTTPVGTFTTDTGGTACIGTTTCAPPSAGTTTTPAATTTTATSP